MIYNLLNSSQLFLGDVSTNILLAIFFVFQSNNNIVFSRCKQNKLCRILNKWRRLFLKNPFYICDLIFTSLIIDMKLASAIYLMFTAILFLLQQLVCLYRDCIDSLTNQTQKAHIQPDTIDGREKAMLYVTMTGLLALWIYNVFQPNKYYLNSKNQG